MKILDALCHWKLDTCGEIHKHIATLQKENDHEAIKKLVRWGFTGGWGGLRESLRGETCSAQGRSERTTGACRIGISMTGAGSTLKTSRGGSSKNGTRLPRSIHAGCCDRLLLTAPLYFYQQTILCCGVCERQANPVVH
jgi:hypothetical protein